MKCLLLSVPKERRKYMARRKLKDLNLLDDFLFGTMMTYPDIGEQFIREILQIIFGKKFGKLDVKPQKVLW